MTDFTLNLVDAIISGRATDIETAFQEAITDKISIAMDTRRTEIAQSMFTKESVEEEELTLEDYSVEELEDFMMSEDFEQLDEEEQEILFELSQGLKDRYIKAATASKNSNTKLQKQYKASSDKHHNAGYDSYKKATSVTNKQKNFNSTLKRPQGRALQPKIDAHQAKSDHEILHRDLDHKLANHAGQQAKKREAGLKRANPNPKPSFLQRVKNKIGLGEELYLEDYSVKELEDFMMSEDFEQLDELSKKTLGSYVKKATTNAIISGEALGKGEKWSKSGQIASKREKGIGKAIDKLTK